MKSAPPPNFLSSTKCGRLSREVKNLEVVQSQACPVGAIHPNSPRGLVVWYQNTNNLGAHQKLQTEATGFQDSGLPRFRDSGIPDSGLPGFWDSGIPGFQDSGIPGFQVSRFPGFHGIPLKKSGRFCGIPRKKSGRFHERFRQRFGHMYDSAHTPQNNLLVLSSGYNAYTK